MPSKTGMPLALSSPNVLYLILNTDPSPVVVTFHHFLCYPEVFVIGDTFLPDSFPCLYMPVSLILLLLEVLFSANKLLVIPLLK